MAGLHGHDLRERGVLDHRNRAEDGIAARDGPLNRFAHARLGPAHGVGEPLNGLIKVRGPLAEYDDGEGITVLDERAPVTIEDHTARRPQGECAEVVLVGPGLVRVVLDDLQQPERDRKQTEADDRRHAENGQPLLQSPPILKTARIPHASDHHCRRFQVDRCRARPRANAPGKPSATVKAKYPPAALKTISSSIAVHTSPGHCC